MNNFDKTKPPANVEFAGGFLVCQETALHFPVRALRHGASRLYEKSGEAAFSSGTSRI